MKKTLNDIARRNAEFVRLDIEGLSLTAIAARMGVSRGCVYGVLVKHRGRRRPSGTPNPEITTT